MSRLERLKREALAEIDVCQSSLQVVTANQVGNARPMVNLYLSYLAPLLTNAADNINRINPAVVEDLQGNDKPTAAVLGNHMNNALRELGSVPSNIGPLQEAYVNDLQMQQESSARLTEIDKRAKYGIAILNKMLEGKSRFFTWTVVLLIVLVGLLIASVSYFKHYAHNPAYGQTPVARVQAAASKDILVISSAAKQPDKSAVEKTVDTTKISFEVLPWTTKLVVEITALITAIQGAITAARKR